MNVLVIPSVRGDPFTCFDCDEENGYIVTGTASGQCALWRTDHITDIIQNTQQKQHNNTENAAKAAAEQIQKHAQTTNTNSTSTPTTDSKEQINSGNTLALPNSLATSSTTSASSTSSTSTHSASPYPSASSSSSSSSSSRSSLSSSSSSSAITYSSGQVRIRCDLLSASHPDPPEYVCRILSRTSDEGVRHIFFSADSPGSLFAVIGDAHVKYWGHYHDLSHQYIKFERVHTYAICTGTYTLRHQDHILLLHPDAGGHVLNLSTMKQHTLRIPLTSKQVLPLFYDIDRLVLLETLESGEKVLHIWDCNKCVLLHQLKYNKAHKFYWGFQIQQNSLAHVCCQNKLKLYSLTDSQQPTNSGGAGGSGGDPDRTTTSHDGTVGIGAIESSKYKHKMQAHAGRILSFLLLPDGSSIVSIGSDSKIKVWRDGKCSSKYVNVAGSFRLGYPYIMKMVENRLYYTADDGIYVLHMTTM